MSTKNHSKLNQIKSKYGYSSKQNAENIKFYQSAQKQKNNSYQINKDRTRNSRQMQIERNQQDMKYRVLSIFSHVEVPKLNQQFFQNQNKARTSELNLLAFPQTFRQQPLKEIKISSHESNYKQEPSYNKAYDPAYDLLQNYRKKIRKSIQKQSSKPKFNTKEEPKKERSLDKYRSSQQNIQPLKASSERGKQIIRPKRCSPLQGIQLSNTSNMKNEISNINKLQKRIQTMLKEKSYR